MTQQAYGTRWYFGWNIVAAASIVSLLAVGLRMGVGPLFLPITHDLGFSRSLLASIIAVGMLCYGIGMPIAGHLVNVRGTRWVMLVGTVMVDAAMVWTVYARDALSFLLAFGVLLSFGLSFTSPVALTPVVSRWFTRQRGMALFFLSTGSMAGIAIVTPILAYAIEAVGWRGALIGYATVFTLLMLPMAWFVIRDEPPPHTDLHPSAINPGASFAAPPSMPWREAVRTMPFWKVGMGLFACGYSMNLLGTQGVPMLVDHGFDTMTSSFGIGLIGLVAIFSTVILGRLSDIWPRKYILVAIYFIRGLGFFGLLVVATPAQLFTVAAVGGVVWAGSVSLSSAILADVYGTRIVGILYGWTYLIHQIGGMISSWLGGWAYERWGTHWVSFGSAGLLLFVAAAISMRLPKKGYTLCPATP